MPFPTLRITPIAATLEGSSFSTEGQGDPDGDIVSMNGSLGFYSSGGQDV